MILMERNEKSGGRALCPAPAFCFPRSLRTRMSKSSRAAKAGILVGDVGIYAVSGDGCEEDAALGDVGARSIWRTDLHAVGDIPMLIPCKLPSRDIPARCGNVDNEGYDGADDEGDKGTIPDPSGHPAFITRFHLHSHGRRSTSQLPA